MDRYEEMLNSIVDSVSVMISDAIKSAPFDKTRSGRIISYLGNRKYTVEVDSKTYTMLAINDTVLSVGKIVKVVIPENQYSNMFILN